MALTIRKIRDANVYVNGTTTHGQSSEITLPNIQPAKAEYKALGMVGVVKLYQGFDAMECTIKWSVPGNDVAIALANPKKAVDLMVRSQMDVYENGSITGEKPVIYYLRGTCGNINGGTLKSKEDNERESKFDLTYYKEVIDGQEIIELDVVNNIFMVGGEDLLATYRENLGI